MMMRYVTAISQFNMTMTWRAPEAHRKQETEDGVSLYMCVVFGNETSNFWKTVFVIRLEGTRQARRNENEENHGLDFYVPTRSPKGCSYPPFRLRLS